MTIPKLTPYTGQVANPDGSQTQTEFTQNMFGQLSYEAQLAAELDATIDGMNQAVTDVEGNANAASASATAAEASASTAGYQGLWPDTGGSATHGEVWQTQIGGKPTGNYFTALQNTSVDPVGDNVNWKVNISASNVRNPNLLSNGQFKVESPDDSLPAPSATPQDYPAGFQIFSGWFADDVNGASGVTRVNDILNWTQDGVSSIYTLVPKDGDLTEYTASLAGKVSGAVTAPDTSHVSFSDSGDGNWRITIANSATDIYSCKFEQGSVATGHEATEPLTAQTVSSTEVTATGSTTPRRLDDRFADYVSVMDFGAVGDGVTDDTDAFQAAMDYKPYSVVYVPPSLIFRITRTLVNNTQFTLQGPENGSAANQAARIYHDPDSTGPLFSVENLTNGATIRNLLIYGGNGSACIQSSIPQVRYEYLYMTDYNGGGIHLLGLESEAPLGTSTARVKGVQWVGEPVPTDYIAFLIDCNGGDVVFENCIAIRGSRGFAIRAGQTIQLLNCQGNKQSTYNGFSSLSDSDTYAIGLAGTELKEAVSIIGGYWEACTNLLIVTDVDGLTVRDNLFADVGVSGVVGEYEAFDNHLINIEGGKNIDISNNKIRASSNGKQSTSQGFYALNIGSSVEGISVKNNNVNVIGDYSNFYKVYGNTDWENNIVKVGPSNPSPLIGEELLNITNKKSDAYVQFTGDGVININNQYNITNVVRNDIGDYTVTTRLNYTNPILNCDGENTSVARTLMISCVQVTPNTFSILCGSDSATPVDGRNMSFSLLR
jgi:hypothetical protein